MLSISKSIWAQKDILSLYSIKNWISIKKSRWFINISDFDPIERTNLLDNLQSYLIRFNYNNEKYPIKKSIIKGKLYANRVIFAKQWTITSQLKLGSFEFLEASDHKIVGNKTFWNAFPFAFFIFQKGLTKIFIMVMLFLIEYRISSYSFLPWILSSLE